MGTAATTHPTGRRGFALPAAVFALIVLGMLVTGGFHVAHQEARVGAASHHGSRALYVAERGLADVVSQTSVASLLALPPLGDTTVSGTVPDGAWEVTVTRTNPRTFFLDGTGRSMEGEVDTRRRIGLIAKLSGITIDPPAALTTQGSLELGGGSTIVGRDTIPPAWTDYCDPFDTRDRPDVLVDGREVSTPSATAIDVSAEPALVDDSPLDMESLLDFQGVGWDGLVELASVKIPAGGTITGAGPDSIRAGASYRCRPGPRNWGDPDSPGSSCYDHFPIIHAVGDLHIASSGSGQGILLVEGDLTVQGGFEFYGPVIVRGTLSTAGTGGRFIGGVIAANVDLDTSTVLGSARIQYSRCAVTRAVLTNSELTRLRPLTDRSWVDLTNVAK
jgi:hypothetical protein